LIPSDSSSFIHQLYFLYNRSDMPYLQQNISKNGNAVNFF
jgi:hypothetical protein